MKNKYITALLLAAFSITANAQIGMGTLAPAASSVVDMTATNKGALLPRIALTSITDVTTIPAPADALTVFNTATAGAIPNDVIPGYYYWSLAASRWIQVTPIQDLRLVGISNHISSDAGVGSNGTSVGTGRNNIAIGKDALMSNTTGIQNIAIGASALKANTSGNGNLVISNDNGDFENSGESNTTGSYNLVLGGSSFVTNTTGNYNVAFGGGSLFSNTTGSYNTAIGGLSTLGQNTVGTMNTAIGTEALPNMINGLGNVAVGVNSLSNFVGDATSMGNIGLGYNPGNNLRSGSDNILIGRNAEAKVSPTGSNQLNIGNWIYGNGGLIGIGIEAANPSQRLDIGNGSVRIRSINAAIGTATDKLVVADATGVLKTVTVASINAANLNFSTLPTYADEAAALAGGLASGKLYKTPTGEIRIKA